MKIHYLRWPDRDELFIPQKALIEISYGRASAEETKYYFHDNREMLNLREIITQKSGQLKGDALDCGDYEISLPLKEGSFEAKDDDIKKILSVKDNPKKFSFLVEKLALDHLEKIILTEYGLRRLLRFSQSIFEF